MTVTLSIYFVDKHIQWRNQEKGWTNSGCTCNGDKFRGAFCQQQQHTNDLAHIIRKQNNGFIKKVTFENSTRKNKGLNKQYP